MFGFMWLEIKTNSNTEALQTTKATKRDRSAHISKVEIGPNRRPKKKDRYRGSDFFLSG